MKIFIWLTGGIAVLFLLLIPITVHDYYFTELPFRDGEFEELLIIDVSVFIVFAAITVLLRRKAKSRPPREQ